MPLLQISQDPKADNINHKACRTGRAKGCAEFLVRSSEQAFAERVPFAAQIDLRFSNKDQGNMAVVVAPVLRFIDVGFNADIRIEEIGPPEKLISGFAPELFGAPLSVSLKAPPGWPVKSVFLKCCLHSCA